MATFATPAQLGVLLGTTTAPANVGPAAELALQAATDDIVAAIGWDPRQSPGRTRVVAASEISSRPPYSVQLPARNVTALAITGADGLPIIASGYSWRADGTITFRSPIRWGELVVTYTAGWPADQLPGVLRTICLEQAARWLDARGQRLKSHTWSIGAAEQEAEVFDVGAADLRRDFRLADLMAPAVA